jgi:hypothetical protein
MSSMMLHARPLGPDSVPGLATGKNLEELRRQEMAASAFAVVFYPNVVAAV